MAYVSDENLFPVWREPRSRWERTGLTRGQQRLLDVGLVLLLIVFSAGWIFSAVEAARRGDTPTIARRIGAAGSPLAPGAPSDVTFALDALVQRFIDWDEVRGESGAVRVIIREPGDTILLPEAVPAEAAVAYLPIDSQVTDTSAALASGTQPASRPGIWNFLVGLRGAVRPVPELNLITLVPRARVREGRIGSYRIGDWPAGEGAYAPPRGFVEVTPENMDTYVSEHFQLKDFLTKGQEGVWPKYVAISTRLLDKLELTLQELRAAGNPVENVFVVSGFRTPWYNRTGGDTSGRGALSRHMYGDAADIAIDNDGNACMDDLNGDGRADVQDARVVAAAAERVEQKYPELIGGIGIYRPVPGSHCGMVHIDTRGHRARW